VKPDVIITMAGNGQRFRDAGYTVPKFQISVHDRTLFTWSIMSLSSFIEAGCRFIFVARKEDATGPFIKRECAALGLTRTALLELDGPTDGQATTAMLATRFFVARETPIVIYNIDTHVAPAALPHEAIRGEGWIPVFPGEGSGWSFVRCDETTGRAVEVREKRRISPHCTVGLYHFASRALFEDACERHYAQNPPDHAGERYIAPVYNRLIADGRMVHIHEIPPDAVIPLGTPAEVEAFEVQRLA
jgi:dTDP-glucose pyrophosphorylase